MTRYSAQLRDRIFVKSQEFLPFGKDMGKSFSKKMSINLSGKTVKNFLIMLNNLQQIRLKLLQKEQFKNKAEATCNLIGIKIANKITNVSTKLQQNNRETVKNEHEKEIPKEKIFRRKTRNY